MRAFLAINPEPTLREQLHRAMEPVRSLGLRVRWVPPENIHLTLKFLGGIDDSRAGAIVEAVERVASRFEPFALRVQGFGAFPSLDRPRVLWIGLDCDPELTELQRAVEEAMQGLGFEPEDREFHPHLTVGRTRSKPSRTALDRLAETTDSLELTGTITVRAVDLMRSDLRPDGARYSVVESATLAS